MERPFAPTRSTSANGARANDARGEAQARPWRHRGALGRRAQAGGINRLRGLCAGDTAPGRSRAARNGCGAWRRQPWRRPSRRHGDGDAVRSRAGVDLGRRAGAAPGRSRRGRGAGKGIQCPPRGNRESHSRPARRAQFRVFLRGPAHDRRDGGSHDRRRAKPPNHLDGQALRPQRAGDRSGRARRAHRPRRDARIGPARLRDRHRARSPRRGDVRL